MLTLMMIFSLAGCGEPEAEVPLFDWLDDTITYIEFDDGTYGFEGRIGSVMKTCWFDFTVTDARITEEEINGYAPSTGNALLLTDMTLTNTFTQSIDMYTWDFYVTWGSDNENEYSYPVETDEAVTETQFPAEYTMKISQTVSGTYIFEVPAEKTDFSITFEEHFDDGTVGNAYRIYFSPQ